MWYFTLIMISNFKAYAQRRVFYALISPSSMAFYKPLSIKFYHNSQFNVDVNKSRVFCRKEAD